MTTIIDGTNGITTPMYNGSITANPVTPSVNMKNRIINGAMVIDQRNAGATSTASGVYTVDRFEFNASQATKITWGQNYGGVTAPVGFSNYLGFKTTTAVSIGSSDYFFFGQKIEGFNFADLNWGTANAKTVTLSFWVQSSLTGTFGGSIENSAGNRSYPFSYTISSANTWEQKSITIAGDTTGTWVGATNGIGAKLWLGLGVGSSFSGTAGAWATADTFSSTGATSVVGTLNATFYITGVQLEVGSTASSFDYRPYGTELALCQRYYYKTIAGSSYGQVGTAFLGSGGTGGSAIFPLPVPMRVLATSVDWSGLATCQYASAPAIAWTAATLNGQQTLNLGQTGFTLGSSGGGTGLSVQIIANNNANAYIGFSAEL